MAYEQFLGRRYGKFSVVAEASIGSSGSRVWVCKCDCGHVKHVQSGNLRRIKHLTCKKDCPILVPCKCKFYNTWYSMIDRCYNKYSKDFNGYGGRGIAVCDSWKEDYFNFHNWAINNWRNGLSMDRIDNDGAYSPDNCRYATSKQQANNRRNNRKIEINGITKTMTEWCEYFGIDLNCVQARLRKGWGIIKTFTKPVNHGIRRNKKVEI